MAGTPVELSREGIEQAAQRICDPARIADALAGAQEADAAEVRDLLHAAQGLSGLTPEHAALLIQVSDPALRGQIRETARQVHQKLWGRRVRLHAPVCPTNRCVQDCAYCPMRRSNARLKRRAATPRDIQREVAGLLDEGHRHVTLVFGDDRSGVQYVRDAVWATYGVRSGMRQILRVDVNLDPLRIVDIRELREAPIGTYHVYQETYHPGAYAQLHPTGSKADYAWRLTAHDRAIEGGLENVGLGLLLGSHDFRFDVVGLVGHVRYLEETFGRSPHTVTYGRMLPTPGAPVTQEPERRISGEDFTFLVAVTRLAMPYVGIVLATPASTEVRRELYGLGVSQVSVGSLSYPGVYTADGQLEAGGALTIGRPRGLETLVHRMCEVGFVPNLCAACFVQRRRAGGPDETDSESRVQDRCAANALLCLREYLMDYASPETQTIGERLIQAELARLPDGVRGVTFDYMKEAEAGLRGQLL
jgi:2-iminoacetate synthase